MDDLRRLCRDKLMRAGFRSNNLDPNARHCMASAVYAFMRTFGMDEPMGCYDDFEHADAFVLWGSNMAEMHPILWTRVADRRLARSCEGRGAFDLQHRSMDLADIPIIFKPQHRPRDPQLHREPHHPDGQGQRGFRGQPHVSFKRGNDDIGYGLRPDNPLELKAGIRRPRAKMEPIDFDAFKAFVDYTLEKAAELTGVEKGFLKHLAELYADPNRQGDVAVDHGLQPAHARRLGQSYGL
jgi:nitrate reductase NapA